MTRTWGRTAGRRYWRSLPRIFRTSSDKPGRRRRPRAHLRGLLLGGPPPLARFRKGLGEAPAEQETPTFLEVGAGSLDAVNNSVDAEYQAHDSDSGSDCAMVGWKGPGEHQRAFLPSAGPAIHGLFHARENRAADFGSPWRCHS
eukprot:s453_g7.t1